MVDVLEPAIITGALPDKSIEKVEPSKVVTSLPLTMSAARTLAPATT